MMLTIASAAVGCVPSSPLTEGAIDRIWVLRDDPTSEAPYRQPAFGEIRLPARWAIRQQRSIVWSTVSIVRALDRMEQGASEVSFSISPSHARALVDLITEAREALRNLAELSEAAEGADRSLWAEKMARTLVGIEKISRMVVLEEDQRLGEDPSDPSGMAAGPLLEMLAVYLNENAGGSLLEDLEPGDIDRLRTVLTQMALRVGFDMAGKRVPDPLRESTVGIMRQAERLDLLERSLTDFLLGSVEDAPPAAREGTMKKVVRLAASWTPRALKVVEGFVRQWDRVESIELELRELYDQPVVVASVNVLPGKEVRIADAMIAQPTLVFRGSSRIVVIPEAPPVGETVVSFPPSPDGSVELQFEGLIYGLVRLLAVPLADGPLREVRVLARPASQGYQMVNVAVLSESRKDEPDPRRLMVFQDVRKKRLLRRAFSVESIDETSEQAFSYITPRRRYTYRRSGKTSDDRGLPIPR